jgi:hypothetical protein
MSAFKDLSGKRFGQWTVQDEWERRTFPGTSIAYWKATCDCGVTRFVQGSALTSGASTSCGHSRSFPFHFQNLYGQRFGRLTVTEEWEIRKSSAGNAKTFWKVVCDCGEVKWVARSGLTCGTSKSCGCLRSQKTIARNLSRTHVDANSSETSPQA